MFPNAFKWMKSFLENTEGITAVQYGLAAAFIAATVIGGVSALGPEINRHLGSAFEPDAGVLDACGKVNPQGKCTANNGKGKTG